MTMGPPGDVVAQRETLRQALDLLVNGEIPSEIRDYLPLEEPEATPG